jgi:PhzF family phenazine biosynthesis protein
LKLNLYQIDAFAEKPFEGNPAAVVPLDGWLPEDTMQAIAEENNLAETAFFVPAEGGYHIRWFTPVREVQLCGHATLASAFVLFEILGYEADLVVFDSLSGRLSVARDSDMLTLDFPNQAPQPCGTPAPLVDGLGCEPLECLRSEDYVAVLGSAEEVASITVDVTALAKLDLRGVIVTAPGSDCDFVARFFAPKYGVPEDPVTGSAYTQLTPYWAGKLGRNDLRARQLSARGGRLHCVLRGERVLISGSAVQYMEGSIEI